MTFKAHEQSNHDGKPVSLYLFVYGESRWSYCSADRAIMHDAIEYLPIAVIENPVSQGGQNEAEFKMSLPSNLPVVELFRGTPPSRPVSLVVRSLHYDDGSGQAPITWISPISNVRRKDAAVSEIVCRNLGLRRGGLRLTWGRQCPYMLFGNGCRVSKAAFAHARTITAIEGNEVTLNVTSPSEGYFNGGFIEWDADGLGTIESRGIERQLSPDTYRMFGRADGLEVGMEVTAYPGCDRTTITCDDKFDNLANNGSVDFMPGKSPFDGSALV